MRVQAVATGSYFGPEQCLTGVSHALAEARKLFRSAAPDMSWADVMSRAGQVRAREPMTLLQALGVVFDQIADGR